MSATKTISEFRGEYGFLSNFSAAKVVMDGVEYFTVEAAFQAAKTLDPERRAYISRLPNPAWARKAGRAKKTVVRPAWEEMKRQVMKDLVRQKFTRHPKLAAKLLATGDAHIVEGHVSNNPYWGMNDGVGENHTGRILMEIRDELRAASGAARLG